MKKKLCDCPNPNEESCMTPEEVEELSEAFQVCDGGSLPNPMLAAYWNDLSNRTLWLDTDIDESYLLYMKYILQWNQEDEEEELPVEERRPIKLYVFSNGGDLDVSFAMIDVIKASKTPIYTYNFGKAYSGGALIYLSGSKRFMLKHSSILLHSGGATDVSGTYSQIQKFNEQYHVKFDHMKQFLIEQCGVDKKEVQKKIETEWYINSDEALKKGLCDEIITNITTLF